VQQPPQRPYVPRHTPTRARPAIASAEFAVSRPYVPGADRERVEALRREYDADGLEEAGKPLPPIERFLDVAAPISAATETERDDDSFSERLAGEEDDLPPVEHFIDPLPAVGDFAANASVASDDALDYPNAQSHADDKSMPEWGETDWQRYDWRAAARLGETGDTEASTAWAATNWDAGMPRSKPGRPTPAQSIALALDELAQKIREGELAPPSPGTITDPATIAATLAALLGIRR
jgi:hypothetical protein